MTTQHQTIISQISPILCSGIVAPICKYLAGKGINITCEEICQNVLMVPCTAQSQAQLPAFMNAGNVTPAAAISGKTTRGRVSKDPPTSAERCVYILTRGQHKGEQCTGRREAGSSLCKPCSKKKGATKYTTGSDAVGVGSPTAVAGMVAPPPSSAPPKIKAVPFGNEPNMYKIVNSGYIIKKLADNSTVALNKLVNDQIVELTDDDKRECSRLGFAIQGNSAVAPPVVPNVGAASVPHMTATAPPMVPQMPTMPVATATPSMPQIPVMPQVPVANAPSSIPQMPAVQQVVPTAAQPASAQQTVPSVPQIPTAVQQTVPSVPQIPTAAQPMSIPQMVPSA